MKRIFPQNEKRGYISKIAESLVSFMEANNMDSHLSHEVLYDLNNI